MSEDAVMRNGQPWYKIEGMENTYTTVPGQKAIPYAPWYEVQWEILKDWVNEKILGKRVD